MPVKVFLARVRAGLVVPEPHAALPEGLAVSVVAELPETGLVAVDPEDAEIIRALHEAERSRLAGSIRVD
ncbi:MAG TPA: hypothetical protein VIZ31_02670 [Vicinamibacteria bacterium]